MEMVNRLLGGREGLYPESGRGRQGKFLAWRASGEQGGRRRLALAREAKCALAGAAGGLSFLEEEAEGRTGDTKETEVAEDVDVGVRGSLAGEAVAGELEGTKGADMWAGVTGHGGGETVELTAKEPGRAGEVVEELVTVGLCVALRDGIGDGDPDAAAGVAGLCFRDGAEGDLGEGDKDHGEADAGEGERPEKGPGRDVEREIAQQKAGVAEQGEAAGDDPAGVQPGDGGADDECGGEGADAARADRKAGTGGGVAEEVLEKHGQDGGKAIKHGTESEDEERSPGEVAIGEGFEGDEWLFRAELVPDVGGEEDDEEDGAPDNADVAKPVLFLPLVKDVLHAGDPDAEKAETDAVELAGVCVLDLRWVFEHVVLHDQRRDADGDVDVEGPPPGDGVSKVAAERRTDDGGEHDAEGEEAEGHALLRGWESVQEDGLRERLEGAAGSTLDDAGEKNEAERRGDAAEEGSEGKDGHGDHQVLLAAEALGEVVGGEQEGGVGDEVDGEDPLGFVGGGGGGTGDVGNRDRGDGGVHDLHEGGHHDRDGDQPGVDFGFGGHALCPPSGAKAANNADSLREWQRTGHYFTQTLGSTLMPGARR